MIIYANVNFDYQNNMKLAVKQLNTALNKNDYLKCRNSFDHISKSHPREWLPIYYTVYCDIRIIYETNEMVSVEQSDSINMLLKKLDNFIESDKSEVNNLWGYYYTALIANNPANAERLFMYAISKYQLAIEQNPNNPRPVCLLALFKQNMPVNMRSEKEISDGKSKAEILFSKEISTWEKPNWGKEYLNMIQ
jgi:hypothetical protein